MFTAVDLKKLFLVLWIWDIF